jgi:hypothetical protein
MIPAQAAIARVRRDLTLSSALKLGLLLAAVAALVLPGLIGLKGSDLLVLMVVGGIWAVLSFRSLQGSRLAAAFPGLIASGQYSIAEEQIEQSLRRFSISRAAKLLSIHHLAVLRHAQRRWPDAAALSRALLSQRLGSLKGLSRQSRLILADALLEMGELPGAYDAMAALYREHLPLAEALALQAVQVDYQARIGAWNQMCDQIAAKCQLADLMPPPAAVRVQALLALAARKAGRDDWAEWLKRRVELLCDVQELCTRRPELWELWSK